MKQVYIMGGGGLENVYSSALSLDRVIESYRRLPGSDRNVCGELAVLPSNIAQLLDIDSGFVSFKDLVNHFVVSNFDVRRGDKPKPKVDSVQLNDGLQNLTSFGYSVGDIIAMYSLFPHLFRYVSDINVLNAKEGFFSEKGFSRDSRKVIYRKLPQIFDYDLGRIGIIHNALENLEGQIITHDNLIDAIVVFPQIYGLDFYGRTLPRVLCAMEKRPEVFEKNTFLRKIALSSKRDNHVIFRKWAGISNDEWNGYVQKAVERATNVAKYI